LHKSLKRHIGMLLITVFIILVLVCSTSTVFLKYNPEGTQGQLQIAATGYMNAPAASGMSLNGENLGKLPESDLPGDTRDSQIPEEDNAEDDPVEQSSEEGIIIEEEEENSLDQTDENSAPADDQDIDFSSSEDFKIEVDLGRQKVLVYYRDELIREMICSGGTEEKPTPLGEFVTSDKGLDFWSGKYNMRAYYWIRFNGDYLFHSVPFDKDRNIIEEEYEKLGSPASHGCIRMELDDAKWLYENIPLGTRVIIYQEN